MQLHPELENFFATTTLTKEQVDSAEKLMWQAIDEVDAIVKATANSDDLDQSVLDAVEKLMHIRSGIEGYRVRFTKTSIAKLIQQRRFREVQLNAAYVAFQYADVLKSPIPVMDDFVDLAENDFGRVKAEQYLRCVH